MDPRLQGLEYGVLADLHDEIVRLTDARRVGMPERRLPGPVQRRLGHGMRLAPLRRLVPRASHELHADVLWVVLMSPEAFTLDLLRDWDRRVGLKILYILDTFESQTRTLRRVVDSVRWDLAITSFSGAVPFLERETDRPWHAVPQGVRLDRFEPSAPECRLIDFSAYGRRDALAHRSLLEWCRGSHRFYDYSVIGRLQPGHDPRDVYALYAWHLVHSAFTLAWPVEATTPGRVRTFSPVTCRWFEAAASATVIVGRAPRDPEFREFFGDDAIIEVGPEARDPSDLWPLWQDLWKQRHDLLQQVAERRRRRAHMWTWQCRVETILRLAGL